MRLGSDDSDTAWLVTADWLDDNDGDGDSLREEVVSSGRHWGYENPNGVGDSIGGVGGDSIGGVGGVGGGVGGVGGGGGSVGGVGGGVGGSVGGGGIGGSDGGVGV